jgi:hypothetical protein
MKTMTKNGTIKRVQDNTAPILEKQGWTFLAKKVWKDMKSGGKTVHTEDAPENMKKTKKNKNIKKKAVEATVDA